MSSERIRTSVFAALAFLLSSLWLTLRPPTSVESSDIILHAVLSIVLAALLLLRAPRALPGKRSARVPVTAAILGLFVFAIGKVFSVNQIQWLGIVAMSFSCLCAALPQVATGDLLKSVFLLYWANPLPSGIFLPLQLFMQKASVAGAEYFLQAINLRVWADGLVIRTGMHIYEIPAWCSGMRTATAILILSLGVGFHKRLPPVKLTIFTLLALGQGLILNILRISLVVLLAPASQDPTGFQLLHDSSGIILIAALFVVLFEMQLWSKYRSRASQAVQEEQRFFRMAFSGFPEFWNHVRESRPLILLIVLLLLLTAGFAFKCRPYHRSEMIKSVAEALRDDGELDAAFRAADEAFQLQPGDEEWNLARIRILLLGGRYEDTLAELEAHFSSHFAHTAGGWEATTIEVAVLRAYALIALKRFEQAAGIVQALPEYAKRNNPLVAMVMAEIGFFLGDIDQVAENIVTASAWAPNARRIRSLYPYLRTHRRWRTIAESDRFAADHTVPVEAFCAMEAAMNIDDTPRLAAQIDAAMARWPADYRLLEPLYFMVLRRSNTKWENRFAEHFLRCLPETSDPDSIFAMIKKAFEIYRADLAWQAYIHLNNIFPDHAGVAMTPGYYGERWFRLTRDAAGIKASQLTPYTDISPFILLAMATPQLRHLTDTVPLREQLLTMHLAKYRMDRIREARRIFVQGKHDYSTAMKFEYARMLEMTGSELEVKSYMNRLAREEQGKDKVTSFVSEINERKGDWLQVYENLKDYEISERATLSTALRLCRAQINLNMYLAANHSAVLTARAFPESSLAAGMLAETEILLDRPEEALKALRKPRAWHDPKLLLPEVRALFMSGRTKAGVDACRAGLIPVPPEFQSRRDISVVAPAEFALLWHNTRIPSMDAFNAYSSRVLIDLDTESPFFSRLYNSWLDAYKAKAGGQTGALSNWVTIGRNGGERATALNLLTLLLCRFGSFDQALASALKAVELMPGSPSLWHPVISLSQSNPTYILEAASHCPDDDDIWLAQLVSASDSRLSQHWPADLGVSALVRQALEERDISPAGLTRGADYLVRIGRQDDATPLATAAAQQDPGYLPAQLTALLCAMRNNDRDVALVTTRQAIHASVRPDMALYQTYVELHHEAPNADDPDLLNALQVLKRAEPDNPRWPPMLAYIRFLRSGWEDVAAFYEFRKAMEMGITNKTTRFFAAEASRRMGNPGRAAQILREMLLSNPDDIEILNNLAYTLACVTENPVAPEPGTTSDLADIPEDSSFITRADALDEAMRIVKKLARLSPSDLSVLDTMTFVLIEAGELSDADKALQMLANASVNDPKYAFKAAIHSARLQMIRSQTDAAEKTLRDAMSSSKGIPDEDLVRANALLTRIVTIQEEKRRQFLDVLKSQPLE